MKDISPVPADFNGGKFRDQIERLEAEQADFLASLEADDNVVTGPAEWFKGSVWSTPAWGAAGYRYRRMLELEAYREKQDETPGLPGMLMMSDSYVEAAISGELNKLDGCQHNQDQAMITAALALAGMVKGWGLNEAEVRGRFFDVCNRLADIPGSRKGPWRQRHFEEKWRNAMQKAEPRAPLLKKGWNGGEPGPKAKPEPKGQLPYGLLIWKEGQPLKGTPGERYFREARGIDISDEVMARMRFHPRVACKALEGAEQPAILNIMTKGFGGEPAAIHATFVGPDGEKPDIDPRKQYFGTWAGTGAAIYLAYPGDDTVTLEGIEKTVAAMNVTGLPGVTGGSGPAMSGMAVDPGIRTLYLGADHGGQEYAEPLAARAHEIGHEVKLSFPPVAGTDWDECPADAVRSTLLDAPVWKPGDTKDRGGNDKWGDPEPLLENLERESYPVHALPDGIREAVTEAAGFLQCPPEMAASSALSALSLAGQGIANVARSETLIGPTSLYYLQAVESGERKSQADKLFTASIEKYQREARETSEVEIKNYRSAVGSWEARKLGITRALSAAAKKGDPTGEIEKRLRDLQATEPVKPRILQLLHENITTEGLAWSLHTGWPTAAVLSPEAGVVLGGHSMRAEAISANLSIINKLWDGASQPVTRRGEGGSYILLFARLTMGLAAQPETIRLFLDKTQGLARGSGFLARFLLAWPSPTGARPYKEDPNWKHLPAFNARILRLLKGAPKPDPKTGLLALETIRFSPDGKAAWIDFYNKTESGRGGDELYSEIKDLASKAPDNAARLAALFHLYAHHGQSDDGGIDADTAGRAAIIAEWHLNEAKRFLSGATTPPARRAVIELDAWLIQRCRKLGVTKIPAAEVLQFGPNPLRTSQERNKALEELSDVNRARLMAVKKKKWIEINPGLLNRGAC